MRSTPARLAGDVGVMDDAMAAVLSPTLIAPTLTIQTITAAAQAQDQIGVPVGADLYLTRTSHPAKPTSGEADPRRSRAPHTS